MKKYERKYPDGWKWLPLLGLLAIAFISQGQSCATTGAVDLETNLVEMIQAERKFIDAIVEATDAKVYYGEVCLFEAMLGPRLQMFPAHFIDALEDLKMALAPYVYESDVSTEEIGRIKERAEPLPLDYCVALQIHGFRIRMAEAIVQYTIKTYIPELLTIIPAMFLFQL